MTYLFLLFVVLVLLILLSGFFSCSETAMMAVNRYKIEHLARNKQHPAHRVKNLLVRPDRLLGIILIGNTAANIIASAVATIIAVNLWGKTGVVFSTVILTIIILIFAEVIPKTLAAFYPERISYLFSLPLTFLLKLFYPLVWFANGIANSVLRLFKIKVNKKNLDSLTHEELRTVVTDAMGKVTSGYQTMILGVLDLGGITVDDIKVPRHEMIGINIEDHWENILTALYTNQYTRLPVYRGSIDQVEGVLHMRKALNLMAQQRLSKATLMAATDEVYFVPEGTPLNVQLINFKNAKQRMGLIVDEYGDIQGLITLEDILEEIVGKFTTDLTLPQDTIRLQNDGSYLIHGSTPLREINRTLGWQLPIYGPKTLNGLIIEHLEILPQAKVSLKIADYIIEVVGFEDNIVEWAKVWYSPPTVVETNE